jgi:hypothetical protein
MNRIFRVGDWEFRFGEGENDENVILEGPAVPPHKVWVPPIGRLHVAVPYLALIAWFEDHIREQELDKIRKKTGSELFSGRFPVHQVSQVHLGLKNLRRLVQQTIGGGRLGSADTFTALTDAETQLEKLVQGFAEIEKRLKEATG